MCSKLDGDMSRVKGWGLKLATGVVTTASTVFARDEALREGTDLPMRSLAITDSGMMAPAP